jgi:hypothetical protein
MNSAQVKLLVLDEFETSVIVEMGLRLFGRAHWYRSMAIASGQSASSYGNRTGRDIWLAWPVNHFVGQLTLRLRRMHGTQREPWHFINGQRALGRQRAIAKYMRHHPGSVGCSSVDRMCASNSADSSGKALRVTVLQIDLNLVSPGPCGIQLRRSFTHL